MKITRILAYRVELPLHETKISKLGGLTMALEDSWGGDITTAAIAHLAHCIPEAFSQTSTDFNSYVTVSTAAGAPQRVDGWMAASRLPGLGVTPKPDVLGKPVVIVK